MRTDTPVHVHLKDYTPYPFEIPEVRLQFDLHPESTRVVNEMRVIRRGNPVAPLALDGESLTLVGVHLDGQPVSSDRITFTDQGITILNVPDAFTLRIETEIAPARNTALSGLYISGGRYCTQCEAEGFRRITYWPDRPDVLSVYTVRINVGDGDTFPFLLSNGNPIDIGSVNETGRWAEWHDPHPKPSYLFALCAGDYDVLSDQFVTRSGRRVALNIYVDKGDGSRAAYAMDCLKRSMKWDEDVFGREYDLEVFNIVAVRDFNFGAMENKGLNIFNSAYILADEQTATDADFEAVESVVAHEYFHNWTGNRITCRDWFQLCLKEGLTVYRDQEFSADMRSRPVQRIKDVIRLRARQFQEDAGPLAHPVRPGSYARIDNLYTATVYEKGAELIRSLRYLIGDEAFQRGMALYFDRFDGTAATIEDFYSCFAEASGRSLDDFLVWYAQAGTPQVRVHEAFDQGSGRYNLVLSQAFDAVPGGAKNKPVPIPLGVTLFDADSRPLPITPGGDTEATIILDQVEQGFQFDMPAGSAPPALSINRNFTAPVRIVRDLDETRAAWLASVDTDPFSQWDGLQRLARTTLLNLAGAIRSGTGVPAHPGQIVSAISAAVERAGASDPAFAALLLRLPDIGELFQDMTPADPQALFQAKSLIETELRARLAGFIDQVLDAPQPTTFSASAEAAGRRALRAACINLLTADGTEAEARLFELFRSSPTMTETMAVLRALGVSHGHRFDTALQAFRDRWNGTPLVMDKWYAVQASSPNARTVARAKALLSEPEFEWSNPNRVRSVAAVLSMGNPVAFHAPDGSGYELLAEVVEKVDRLNPALSARLLTAFEPWRKLDAASQEQAERQLQRLQRHGLSGNAADIVNRALSSA